MSGIGFINGRFLPIDAPVVPIDERGHQFGDGVYEVVRVVNGQLLLFDEHMERFAGSSRAIRIEMPYDGETWRSYVQEGIRLTGLQDAEIYMQITRGVAPRKHPFPDVAPSATMTIRPMRPIDPSIYDEGVHVIFHPDVRWAYCSIKSLNLLPNILAKQEALDHDAYESVFVRDGIVTEGSSTNVFAVRNGVIYTHPATPNILNGITRQFLLKAAASMGIEVRETPFTQDDLILADEAFLSSSVMEVVPIRSIVGTPFADRKPGPITQSMLKSHRALYQ